MTGFVLEYAWRDLTDPGSARTTRVTVVTLLAAVAATVGGFGYTQAVDALARRELKADPFSRTVWTGSQFADRLTPEVLAGLRAAVPPGTRVRPFHNVAVMFEHRSGHVLSPTVGRTIGLDPADPDDLFNSRPARAGRVLAGPADAGVVATAALLRSLGHDPAEVAAGLTLGGYYLQDGRQSERQPVPVVGVVDDLPTFHQFVLTPEYVRDLGTSFGDPKGYPSVYTTPVPDEWREFSTRGLPPRAVEAAATKADARDSLLEERPVDRFEVRAVRRRGRPVWQLILPQGRNGLSAGRWREVVGGLDAELRAARPSAGRVGLDTDGMPTVRPPEPPAYDMCAVVAPDLDAIETVTEVIPKVPAGGDPLPVNPEPAEKVRRVKRQTRLMVGAVAVVELFLVLIAGWNLFAVQAMRADRQTAEVGMLKAMGMSRRAVLAVYLTEAAVLLVPAAAAGAVLGAGAVVAAVAYEYRDLGPLWAELTAEPGWAVRLIGWVLGGAVVLTLGCVGLATARAVLASPVDALREGR